jgi:uncharacterized protein YceH (UPF0502 family)
VEPTAVEMRVLGCLIEKQRTTPDAYPLSLNALRLACNQSTNRDPVVSYDEPTVREALSHLSRRRWARLASGAGSRAAKYRHLLDETLGLDRRELALLAVLMLRGAQTPGELSQRAERLEPFGGLPAVETTLERLASRGFARRLDRRPGQKEARYLQLLSEEAGDEREEASGSVVPAAAEAAEDPVDALAARVETLERELAAVRAELARLRDA